MAGDITLNISSLTKHYGKKLALENVDLVLHEGIYGLLGPNGAGKSTLINLITDNLKRESGKICWNGQDILESGKEYRKILGFMPQQQGYYGDWTAENFLIYMARLKGLDRGRAKIRTWELLEKFGLDHVKRNTIKSFSGGMRQRLLFAQALISDPKLLILDEPTAGIDTSERIFIRNYISKISSGKVVLLATHIVSDIEAIADNIIIMKAGRVLRVEKPEILTTELQGEVYESVIVPEELSKVYLRCPVSNERRIPSGILVRTIGKEAGHELGGHEVEPELEDVYLKYFPDEIVCR